MENLKEYLKLYKAGKLSKMATEMEINKALDMLKTKVCFEDSATNNANTSFIACMVPELCDKCGALKLHLVFDNRFVMTLLNEDEIISILEGFKKGYQTIIREFNNFIQLHKDGEITLAETLLEYATLYSLSLNYIPIDVVNKLTDSGAFVPGRVTDVLVALKTGNEELNKTIEFCLVNHVVPKCLIDLSEKLFKDLNGIEQSIDDSVVNGVYNRMKELSTGNINPEYHKDIDPDYIPKR